MYCKAAHGCVRAEPVPPYRWTFAGVVLLLTTVTAGKILIGRAGPYRRRRRRPGRAPVRSHHHGDRVLGVALMLLLPDLPARARRAAVAAVAGWALAGLIVQAAVKLARCPLPRRVIPLRGRGRG
jgi:hypothetical protein